MSTASLPRAAARLAASASTVVVTGMLLSGISSTVVTPPAAAAAVPVAKPSHSVRPGSLRCTCESTSPGISTRSSASTNEAVLSNRVMLEMRPSVTCTVAGSNREPVNTRRAAITCSAAGGAASMTPTLGRMGVRGVTSEPEGMERSPW